MPTPTTLKNPNPRPPSPPTPPPREGPVNPKAYTAAALQLADSSSRKITPLSRETAKYLERAALKEDPTVFRTLRAFAEEQEKIRDSIAKSAPKRVFTPIEATDPTERVTTPITSDEEVHAPPSTTQSSKLRKTAHLVTKTLFYSSLLATAALVASAALPYACSTAAMAALPDVGFCAATVAPATAFNAAVLTAASAGLASVKEAAVAIHSIKNYGDFVDKLQNWYRGEGFKETCTNWFFSC